MKEAKIREQAGKVGVAAAQRRLLADLTEFYHEADASRQQLVKLEESVTDARETLSKVVTPVA
ncbi:MAG: hypothetical protein WBY75_13970 [Terracidiphilus sp.]